jgi:Arc/MetJ-type ribon-helix-helix transcriptional regulator
VDKQTFWRDNIYKSLRHPKNMTEKDLTISLPESTHAKLAEMAKGSEFSSAQEYVRFVINQLVEQRSQEQDKSMLSEEERQKKRLEELGYV